MPPYVVFILNHWYELPTGISWPQARQRVAFCDFFTKCVRAMVFLLSSGAGLLRPEPVRDLAPALCSSCSAQGLHDRLRVRLAVRTELDHASAACPVQLERLLRVAADGDDDLVLDEVTDRLLASDESAADAGENGRDPLAVDVGLGDCEMHLGLLSRVVRDRTGQGLCRPQPL